MISPMEAAFITEVAKELNEQRKLEEKKKEMEELKKFQKEIKKICDTIISDMIIAESKRGRRWLSIEFSACGYTRIGGKSTCYMGIIEEKVRYANRKPSYIADVNAPLVNVSMICDYLVSCGYEVQKFTHTYNEYGHGARTAERITISW